jgi:hypothetical protein
MALLIKLINLKKYLHKINFMIRINIKLIKKNKNQINYNSEIYKIKFRLKISL